MFRHPGILRADGLLLLDGAHRDAGATAEPLAVVGVGTPVSLVQQFGDANTKCEAFASVLPLTASQVASACRGGALAVAPRALAPWYFSMLEAADYFVAVGAAAEDLALAPSSLLLLWAAVEATHGNNTPSRRTSPPTLSPAQPRRAAAVPAASPFAAPRRVRRQSAAAPSSVAHGMFSLAKREGKNTR
jgi:hypothetical protein